MVRFAANRGWAFILTLCLLTACFVVLAPSLSPPAWAEHSLGDSPSDAIDAPAMTGDPDVPMGPGDGAPSRLVTGSSGQVASQTAVTPVYLGGTARSVVVNRLHLVVLGLRICLLRF